MDICDIGDDSPADHQEDGGGRQRGPAGSERSHLTSTTVETERLVSKAMMILMILVILIFWVP